MGEKKDVEPEKEKVMETQDDIKEDSDFEVIPEVSKKTSIYPTLLLRSRLACGKPTQGSLRIRTGKRPLRRWTRTHTLVLRTCRSSPEKEKTRQWKSKCQHKRKRQMKRRRRTLSQKRKRKWRPRMTLRMTQTSK